MNQLPKWVIANPFPAIHDFESLTVIDQTARIYGAMQTLIGEYNKFADSVNTALGTFTEDETTARAEFETNITELYRAFSCQMEKYLRLNLDDTAAKVIIDGMNNGSIPVPTDAGLSKEKYPAEAKATGDAIAANAAALANEIALERERINNLVANPGESTEGNTELTDIRVGWDSTTYPTAGEAVRAQGRNSYRLTVNEKESSLLATENGYHSNYNHFALWESGAIDTNGLVSNNARIRTKGYLNKNIKQIEINSDYSFMVYRYINDVVDAAFYTGWVKSITLDQNTYDYKCLIKKDDGSEIGSDILSHYKAINLYAFPIYEKKVFVIDKNGGGDFTSLVKGLRKAYAYKDATFHVKNGVYDIIREFIDEYGENFFSDYTTESIRGIVLLNGCKVIFSPLASVNCHYEGDNDIVKQYFSPFNSGEGGFEIYGLQLYASNVRYCFHDELGSNAVPYISKYRNCYMKLDNSNNSAWPADQCIGGGLGKSGLIDISGCIFESTRGGTDLAAVSYHNSAVVNAKSQIVIDGNYIAGNKTIRLSWFGESESVTNAIVTNNNLGSDIIFRAENESAVNKNIQLLEWNNIVRR